MTKNRPFAAVAALVMATFSNVALANGGYGHYYGGHTTTTTTTTTTYYPPGGHYYAPPGWEVRPAPGWPAASVPHWQAPGLYYYGRGATQPLGVTTYHVCPDGRVVFPPATCLKE